MRKKRTIRIVVEREREVVIRQGQTREAWCSSCGAQVQLVTIADAARSAGLSELALYEQLGLRALHFDESPDGRALVCLNSLRQQTGKTATVLKDTENRI